jgi:hypothetical protein
MTGYNSTVTKQNKSKPCSSARLFVFDVVAEWRDAAFFPFLSFPLLSFSDSPFLLLLFHPTLQHETTERAKDDVDTHAFPSLQGRDGTSNFSLLRDRLAIPFA